MGEKLLHPEVLHAWRTKIVTEDDPPLLDAMVDFITVQAELQYMPDEPRYDQHDTSERPRCKQQHSNSSHQSSNHSNHEPDTKPKIDTRPRQTEHIQVCGSCRGQHYVLACENFKKMKPAKRVLHAKDQGSASTVCPRHMQSQNAPARTGANSVACLITLGCTLSSREATGRLGPFLLQIPKTTWQQQEKLFQKQTAEK